MSTTTTFTANELQDVLSDNTLHLTGYDDTYDQDNRDIPRSSGLPVQNPPGWPSDRLRIPNHRPLNRNLDSELRPRGSNTAEFIFINMMFTGVFFNASLAKLWGMTGGPYFPDVFKYAVGGEW